MKYRISALVTALVMLAVLAVPASAAAPQLAVSSTGKVLSKVLVSVPVTVTCDEYTEGWLWGDLRQAVGQQVADGDTTGDSYIVCDPANGGSVTEVLQFIADEDSASFRKGKAMVRVEYDYNSSAGYGYIDTGYQSIKLN